MVLILTLAFSVLEAQKVDDQVGQEVHIISGKVIKMDNRSLTINSPIKGSDKSETITFLLSEDTEKPAELAVGSEVRVEYKEQGDVKIATRVTLKPVPVKP